jgi:hypothetical protein
MNMTCRSQHKYLLFSNITRHFFNCLIIRDIKKSRKIYSHLLHTVRILHHRNTHVTTVTLRSTLTLQNSRLCYGPQNVDFHSDFPFKIMCAPYFNSDRDCVSPVIVNNHKALISLLSNLHLPIPLSVLTPSAVLMTSVHTVVWYCHTQPYEKEGTAVSPYKLLSLYC